MRYGIVIYISGYFISAIYFALREFNYFQKKYTLVAIENKESDLQFGILMGVIKACIWPILLPIILILDLIIKLRG